MKILVIEDEAILREEVMEWLMIEGYEVAGAGDGVEGVSLAHQLLPDLILCDISMPRMDGYDVMLEIRSKPLTQLTPFIYMTARASHEDIRQGMSLGADDYITKPFTRLDLLQAVQTRAEKKALQEQYRQAEIEQWQQALKLEHEQRLLKSKMVAMFSHDFRNPLTSIMGANNILRTYLDRMDEQRRQHHFNRIDASVQQLVQMLDDMLVVAQLEAGSLNFEPARMILPPFLEHIIEEFRLGHPTHMLIFRSDCHRIVMGDQRLIRQIVANLLSNAIKYSSPGSEVKVSLECLPQEIVLTVQDQGIGIPEADQARLFDAFQRASNVGSVVGTGLGLAVVQHAVNSHGGTIHLESQVDVGTKFTVRLPG